MAVKHTKKLFIKALNKKFGKDFDLAGQKVEYKRLGIEQNARKREFIEYAKKLEGKRGMTGYNPMVHAGGIPMGQKAARTLQALWNRVCCRRRRSALCQQPSHSADVG